MRDTGMWQRYADIDRDSGVVAFEVLDNGISVQFADNSRYTYLSPPNSQATIATMIRLAKSGDGLNSFISRNKPHYKRP